MGDDASADDGTSAVILHFHGGGYVMAGSHTHVGMLSRLASGCGGRALSVDYRLAPEEPFPAAAQDALCAYRWLLDQGVAAERIVVAGDSAGGGLALGLLVRRPRRRRPPAGGRAVDVALGRPDQQRGDGVRQRGHRPDPEPAGAAALGHALRRRQPGRSPRLSAVRRPGRPGPDHDAGGRARDPPRRRGAARPNGWSPPGAPPRWPCGTR